MKSSQENIACSFAFPMPLREVNKKSNWNVHAKLLADYHQVNWNDCTYKLNNHSKGKTGQYLNFRHRQPDSCRNSGHDTPKPLFMPDKKALLVPSSVSSFDSISRNHRGSLLSLSSGTEGSTGRSAWDSITLAHWMSESGDSRTMSMIHTVSAPLTKTVKW